VAEETQKKKWIQGAIKHPGALTKKADDAGESVGVYAREHEHDSGITGKQSRLAMTLKHMHHAHKKNSASNKTIRKSMYHGE
jgi:hypothetical protein